MMRAAVLLLTVLLAGCVSMFTRWDCAVPTCLPKYQATNKCLAQANAAPTGRAGKSTIWAQCMRGEGYAERACTEPELDDPACQVFHVR